LHHFSASQPAIEELSSRGPKEKIRKTRADRKVDQNADTLVQCGQDTTKTIEQKSPRHYILFPI